MGEVSQGKLIRKYRKQRGMNQSDLADALNVSQPTISAWELDRWRVPRSKVGFVAHVLGVAADDLKTAIATTEFTEDDPVVTEVPDLQDSGTVAATFLALEQELERFRHLNDRLSSYLERVVQVEPILERLEAAAATPPTARGGR